MQLAGWFPLYDSLRGACGELSIVVKMDFVGDVNPFKESGAGVQFLSVERVPAGQRLASVVGLVEELIVVPDPEYHWVDSFRTARLSNERRQLLLYELSGKLRRQMGRKVLEAGGNHVLGYQQSFDLEGEHSGVIVARGLGTSVKLRPEADPRSLLSPRKPEAHEAHHHHLSHHGRLSSPEAGHLASLQPSPASAAHGTPLRGAHGTPLASPQPGALALGSGSGALAGLLSDPAHPSHPAHAAHAALAAHPAQPSRKHLRRSSSGDVPRSSPSGLLLPGNQADMNAGLGQRGRRRHTHNLDHDGSSGLGSSPAAGMSTLEEREREAHGNLPALELPARRGVSWSRSVGAKGGTIAAQEVALLTIETCHGYTYYGDTYYGDTY